MPELVPTVSVAIPVYNGQKYIQGCLESVFAALNRLPEGDRPRVEIVVCDNHSDDGTAELLESLAQERPFALVRPEVHLPNRTDNWNYAIRATSAEWVQMLHADDLMAEGALLGRLRAVARPAAARAVMIAARHRTFGSDGAPGRIRPTWPKAGILKGSLVARHVLPYHCPFVPFTLFRRSAFEQVGGFDSRWELVQDWDLWSRMLAVGDLLYDPHESGFWRIHPVSPQYLEIFASEHEALAALLPARIPEFTADAAGKAEQLNAARASVLRPASPVSRITKLRVRSLPRTAGLKMNGLRAMGTARLLTAGTT